MKVRLSCLLAALTIGFAGCADGPREIRVGAEECEHCRMMLSEERFTSQLLTDRGRHHVFDSIECMAEFVDDGEVVSRDRIRSLWVTDFTRPGEWLAVEEAHFLRSEELRSPMGLNLSAFADADAAHEHMETFGGEMMDWSGVLALVAEAGVVSGHAHGAGHVR